MNHHDTWGHPISKSQIRRRSARRNIILLVAFGASLMFAYLATAGANNVIAHNIATTCGAC